MPVFFNNCRGRDHVGLFGSDAFFDLLQTGRQATMARGLRPGDECVVATPDADGNVVFGWYAFTREAVLPDPTDGEVRVLFGDHLRSETLCRQEATATEPYSEFFNVNGHFKRPSVIRPRRAALARG